MDTIPLGERCRKPLAGDLPLGIASKLASYNLHEDVLAFRSFFPLSGISIQNAQPKPFDQPPLPLLAKPTNVITKRIFVAATRMNDGKTTACLGLFAALQNLYPRVGFIKPVGQRYVEVEGHKVDEDSYLLDMVYKVRVPIESMSPITIDPTFTRRFLANPQETYAGWWTGSAGRLTGSRGKRILR